MNHTFQIQALEQGKVIERIVFMNPPENLGSMGVFISSVLLSFGGFLAVLFSSLRNSRCSTVDCLCFKCDRENLVSTDGTV